VDMEPEELIQHTQRELAEVLPALAQDGLQWGTYRVDRAEQKTAGGKRPESFGIKQDGNLLTVWPTKLVLAPVVAETLLPKLHHTAEWTEAESERLANWSKPAVALPPWEIPGNWLSSALRRSA